MASRCKLVGYEIIRRDYKHFQTNLFVDDRFKIFGSARLRMDSYGIAADNQVFNLVRVERGLEFFEVFREHRAWVPSIGTG